MIVLLLFLCFHVCTCSLHTRSVGSLCTEAKKLAYIPVWRLKSCPDIQSWYRRKQTARCTKSVESVSNKVANVSELTPADIRWPVANYSEHLTAM